MSISSEDVLWLRELADREQIRDCMMRYCHGVDRCDPDMVKSAYWPDAHDVHGDFDGNAYDFVDWAMPQLRKMVRTQHFIGNLLIRIDGDRARTEMYSRNWHTFRTAAGRLHDVIQGHRYLDKLEKRGGEWRIFDRLCITDWLMENPQSLDLTQGALGQEQLRLGRRAPDDPLYRFLGAIPAAPIRPGAEA